jgi:hypothetical protein
MALSTTTTLSMSMSMSWSRWRILSSLRVSRRLTVRLSDTFNDTLTITQSKSLDHHHYHYPQVLQPIPIRMMPNVLSCQHQPHKAYIPQILPTNDSDSDSDCRPVLALALSAANSDSDSDSLSAQSCPAPRSGPRPHLQSLSSSVISSTLNDQRHFLKRIRNNSCLITTSRIRMAADTTRHFSIQPNQSNTSPPPPPTTTTATTLTTPAPSLTLDPAPPDSESQQHTVEANPDRYQSALYRLYRVGVIEKMKLGLDNMIVCLFLSSCIVFCS